MASTCEAAYVGAWVQCAAHVAAVTGEALNGDDNPVFHEVKVAIADLKEHYRVDALAALSMTWHDVLTLEREKCQKQLALAVTDVLCEQWKRALPPLAHSVVGSAGAGRETPGAGDWLLASPRSRATSMPDNALLCLLRARLRCDLVPPTASMRVSNSKKQPRM